MTDDDFKLLLAKLGTVDPEAVKLGTAIYDAIDASPVPIFTALGLLSFIHSTLMFEARDFMEAAIAAAPPAPTPDPSPAPPAPTPTPPPTPVATAGTPLRLNQLGSAVVEMGDATAGWGYSAPTVAAAIDASGTQLAACTTQSLAGDGMVTLELGTLLDADAAGTPGVSDIWVMQCGFGPGLMIAVYCDGQSFTWKRPDDPYAALDNDAMPPPPTAGARLRWATVNGVVSVWVQSSSAVDWYLVHAFDEPATGPLYFHLGSSKYSGVTQVLGATGFTAA